MKAIAPFTKLQPFQRMEETGRLVEVLNKNGRLRIGLPKKIAAFQLFQPNARLFNSTLKNKGDGNMVLREKLKTPINFKDYVIVYSLGKDPKFDDREADNLVDILYQASGAFGVNFSKPGFISFSGGI